MRNWIIWIIFFVLLGMASFADNFTLSTDNDLWGSKNTDRHYTHSTHLSLSKDVDRHWADDYFGKVSRVSYSFAQYMYSPTNIATEIVDPNDRRFAGITYAGYGIYSEGIDNGRSLEIDVGALGPSSFSEETQIWVHKNIGSPRPSWAGQLEDRPTVNVTYQEKYRPFRFKNYLDTIMFGGGSAGNVVTMANVGGTARAGWNVPADFGTVRLEPTPRTFGSNFRFYGVTIVEGRALADNEFLEGVDAEPFVGDFSYGGGIGIYALDIKFLRTIRTKEFDKQTDMDSFGSFSITYSW